MGPYDALRSVVAQHADAERFFDTTPAMVEHKARQMLLDTIGCMLAARGAPEVMGLESEFSALESGAFVFPGGRRLSALGAAAVGAMAATWDEACEGLALAHGRPGVPVIAALLPQAIARDVKLEALLSSLVAGYEVGARAGAWLRIRPGMHVDGNWPALGVAAGMAHLLSLPVGMRMAAVDIAACQLPTSLYLPVARGANARNTYLAHSAWLGLLAALSAAGGVSAPADAATYYATHFAREDADAAVGASRALILESYLKPHAAVRHAHYGAEAARRLRDRIEGKTAAISAIQLRIYQEAITYCGNRAPQTPIQGQFSLSFGLAAGLRHGGIEAGVYRKEKFHDAELRRLEALVDVEADAELTANNARGAFLEIRAGDETHSVRVDAIKGDPDLPMTDEEIAAKFMRYAAASVPAEKAYNFASVLLRVKGETPFRSIWDLLF